MEPSQPVSGEDEDVAGGRRVGGAAVSLEEAARTSYVGRRAPVVAVLMTSRNRRRQLLRALDALADQRSLPPGTALRVHLVSSYGAGTQSSGVVRILKDLDTDIQGKHVLIVEDIIDSGLTLSWLISNLGSRGPASLKVCTLLRKPEAAKVAIDVEWVGFDIPNEFVVGYGLDFAEKYRNLPFVGTLAPHVYGG